MTAMPIITDTRKSGTIGDGAAGETTTEELRYCPAIALTNFDGQFATVTD